jgi:Ca2+-binding RTX toxin-like protein
MSAKRFSSFESLEERRLFAVSAVFAASTGILNVMGDANPNQIVISRDAAGKLLVNGGAVTITGGTSTVANTSLIQVFGQGENDGISLSEVNGALPKANLFGGAGSDTLTGGSGADQLFGQGGSDVLLGKGDADFLFGGDGNDVLTAGTGDDSAFGEAGNDRMIWNPGEGTDLNEGGDGIDTIEVNGGNGAEVFTATPNGTRVRFDRVSPAPFSLDIGTSENLVLNANGGDDTFTGANGLAPLIALVVDGGAGNDTITGGDGADTLLGGDSNDLITPGRGSDLALAGAGEDTLVWNPGDGSDTFEGQDGTDTMQFNGSNVSEKIDLSNNGGRLRFTRDVAAIVMDVNDVEIVNFVALGGADQIAVNNLANTDVTQFNVNLESTPGSATGDGSADSVIVTGTNNPDAIDIVGAGLSYSVVGLSTLVNVTGSEGANDSLTVNALGGADTISAGTLPAGVVKLTIDGGNAGDIINGSQGDDLLIGGLGSDLITGNRGNDTALMGDDNDTFVWNPGDGSDIVEGQAGFDTMLFNGSNIGESFDVSANASRLRFARDVGGIVMDTNGLEQINLNALGGADTITVNDLTGTGLTNLSLNLSGIPGGNTGDGAIDNVIVNATNGADIVTIATMLAGGVKIGGLAALIKISGTESTDNLTVNALGSDDTVNASSLTADVMNLTENGGAGLDTLTGSQGNDLITGGQGNDVILMGAGDDTFVWNPGDGSDVVEGQAGADTLLFNGANVSENIEMSSNGGRFRLTRDVAAITMDVDDVETVTLNTLGGSDKVTVNDLTGTDVTTLNINLAATGGAGDGLIDQVILNATNGDDVILVSGDATTATVIGLFSKVNITGAETQDSLVVSALAGDDVVDASGLSASAIAFTADGGIDDDILIGGAGNDTLLGNDGDDVLIGGPGPDALDGGTGNNILLQD